MRPNDARVGRAFGIVTDSSGAVVPKARVEAIDIERGLQRETQSNADGAFLFPTVTPGTTRSA